RSSLLRRAFRHASSVVAALAALAPRLVRLAHHDHSDGLLGVDLERYLAARARLVERALAARFPPARTRLRQAMRYSLLAGGKRIRPVLALAAGEAAAAGEAGRVGGQALDVAAGGSRPSLRRVQDIHRRKTGALLRSAVRVGALVAGADARTLRRLTAYGEHLGLAFQIADDILDASGDPEADGRTDHELGKATYPGVLGLAGARAAAARERDAALAALRGLGRAAEALRALAAYVVARAS